MSQMTRVTFSVMFEESRRRKRKEAKQTSCLSPQGILQDPLSTILSFSISEKQKKSSKSSELEIQDSQISGLCSARNNSSLEDLQVPREIRRHDVVEHQRVWPLQGPHFLTYSIIKSMYIDMFKDYHVHVQVRRKWQGRITVVPQATVHKL